MELIRNEKRQALIIMKMSKLFRSEEDITFLARYFKEYKAFSNVSASMMRSLCTIMTSVEYEAGQTVFSQGDVGEEWYIIQTGMVKILLSKTGDPIDNFKICSLTSGAGFGELALVNAIPRTASVIAEETTELIRVAKFDYERIMKSSHEEDVHEKIVFLKKTEPFKQWSIGLLKEMAQEAKWVSFKIGEELVTEGECSDYMYFLRKGCCNVFAKYEMNSDKDSDKGRVKVGKMEVCSNMLLNT
jgi:CRP/FNR family cyclic AMP-dependent transcriptional regulator